MQGGTRVERPKELQTSVLIEIQQLLRKYNFKNIMRFYILKCSIIEWTKFTVQTFPSINTYCFDYENGELIGFLPSIHEHVFEERSKGKNVGLSWCHFPHVWFNRSGYIGTIFLFYAYTSDITKSIYSTYIYDIWAYCL